MSGNAWVTLATNDSYALGTLVLASSLRAVGTTHQLAVMVTRGVSPEMKEQLRSAFDLLFEVNILDSQDEVNLSLLSRPELGLTFTKLHCWRLTQFQKCVFMDADTMVVRNCDELFDREELSAAPDAGWPDCFNSGVFVYRPSLETFRALLSFAVTHGSFDGGDQGLLNSFFADWATKDIAFHLPFIYNMCSNAVYSYLPAYKNYGDSVKIVHFIGPNKPWLMHFDVETGCVHPPAGFHHVLPLLQKWWDIFFASVHSRLSSTMARQDTPTVSRHVADSTMGLHSQPDEDFCYGHWDPWETIDLEQTVSLQHVPPTNNHLPHQEPAVHHVEHIEPTHTLHSPHFVAFNHAHDTNAHDKSFSSGDLHNGDSGGGLQNFHIVPVIEHDASSKSVAHDVPHNSVVQLNNSLCKTNSGVISENKNSPTFASSPLSESHGTLLHSAAQDSMPPSTAHLADPCLAMHVVNSDAPVVCARITSQGECLVDETAGSSKASDPSPRNAGLAGAFAQLRLGAPRSDAQTALEEHLRRQNWEQGQADYMGSDSFDNIWNKICTTLSAAPGKQSRIKSTDEQATENKTEAVVEGEEPKVETTVAKSTEASVSPTAASDSPIVSLQEKQSSKKI
ncbi:glycogenin-1 isoform X3 [Bacillus rossius redtenbacheri]|uniref:glycogenin-1 isoform X3 n=1 Tax=Bacillus rossius redtenbacheri TaxID=93214 RepID=UPI002FDDE4AF